MVFPVYMRSGLNACMPWLSRIVALSAVIILVGLMPDIAGIDPAQAILRARAGANQLLTAEALQSIRDDLQLDRSAYERLLEWLRLALQGDFGISWVDGSPVMKSIQHTAKTSLLLMMSALGMTFVLCTVSVFYTVNRWQKNRLDNNHNSLSSVLVSLPEYVVAALLILLFSIWLGWFPPFGWRGYKTSGYQVLLWLCQQVGCSVDYSVTA